MADINTLMTNAIRRSARQNSRDPEVALRERQKRERAQPAEDPHGAGRLTVERRQGRWRCYLAGERIRSGEDVEVYLNPTAGWVLGQLYWPRRPNTPPVIRFQVSHPTAKDTEDEPVSLGEAELQIPLQALCRWPTTP